MSASRGHVSGQDLDPEIDHRADHAQEGDGSKQAAPSVRRVLRRLLGERDTDNDDANGERGVHMTSMWLVRVPLTSPV